MWIEIDIDALERAAEYYWKLKTEFENEKIALQSAIYPTWEAYKGRLADKANADYLEILEGNAPSSYRSIIEEITKVFETLRDALDVFKVELSRCESLHSIFDGGSSFIRPNGGRLKLDLNAANELLAELDDILDSDLNLYGGSSTSLYRAWGNNVDDFGGSLKMHSYNPNNYHDDMLKTIDSVKNKIEEYRNEVYTYVKNVEAIQDYMMYVFKQNEAIGKLINRTNYAKANGIDINKRILDVLNEKAPEEYTSEERELFRYLTETLMKHPETVENWVSADGKYDVYDILLNGVIGSNQSDRLEEMGYESKELYKIWYLSDENDREFLEDFWGENYVKAFDKDPNILNNATFIYVADYSRRIVQREAEKGSEGDYTELENIMNAIFYNEHEINTYNYVNHKMEPPRTLENALPSVLVGNRRKASKEYCKKLKEMSLLLSQHESEIVISNYENYNLENKEDREKLSQAFERNTALGYTASLYAAGEDILGNGDFFETARKNKVDRPAAVNFSIKEFSYATGFSGALIFDYETLNTGDEIRNVIKLNMNYSAAEQSQAHLEAEIRGYRNQLDNLYSSAVLKSVFELAVSDMKGKIEEVPLVKPLITTIESKKKYNELETSLNKKEEAKSNQIWGVSGGYDIFGESNTVWQGVYSLEKLFMYRKWSNEGITALGVTEEQKDAMLKSIKVGEDKNSIIQMINGGVDNITAGIEKDDLNKVMKELNNTYQQAVERCPADRWQAHDIMTQFGEGAKNLIKD